MREIKFRAYIKTIHQMIHICGFKYINNFIQIFYTNDDGDYCNQTYKKEDVLLMQFTGIYDKNGKEIYEGNIIEISDSMMLQFRNTIIEGYKNFGIIFYGGNFVLRPWLDECYYNTFRNNSWRLGNIYSQDMKIIGNIYENPELLERE